MPEFSATELRAVLTRIKRQARAADRQGLIGTSEAVVKQAKVNASNGSHQYGTPTPASPGSGPARISGTLRNSIDRTAAKATADGWTVNVGLVPGRFPPYRKGRSTESSKYGLYLETGLKNGATYPFLLPATRMLPVQAEVFFKKAYDAISWLG